MSLDPDSEQPIAKILDFGLSDIIAIKTRSIFSISLSLFPLLLSYPFFVKRAPLMTWQWIAPEVLSTSLSDHRIDIYR